jgi:hypothetical protein
MTKKAISPSSAVTMMASAVATAGVTIIAGMVTTRRGGTSGVTGWYVGALRFAAPAA